MRPARALTIALLGLTGLVADQPFQALSGGCGGQAQAQTSLAANQPACYGRVYDQAHLSKHPRQKVTSLYVWRSVEDRKEAENYTARKAEDQPEGFGVDAYVTFRDRRGNFQNSLWCGGPGDDSKGKNRCSIDCDGGSFVLEQDNANSMLLRNNGFVLIGGCGDDVEESKTVYFDPGADDKVFRLERKDPSVCRAEEQKAKPLRLGFGKPLRERFKADEPFCLGRDYDAAHLAKNPQQKVASVRVGRLDPAKERQGAEAGDLPFPWTVKLSIAIKLKSAGAGRSIHYSCSPLESSWECDMNRDGNPEASSCDGRRIHLARGPGDDVFLINRKDGLPIEAACGPRDPEKDPVTRDTRSDDKSFRLKRMPVEACR